jgi:hypothetical protein
VRERETLQFAGLSAWLRPCAFCWNGPSRRLEVSVTRECLGIVLLPMLLAFSCGRAEQFPTAATPNDEALDVNGCLPAGLYGSVPRVEGCSDSCWLSNLIRAGGGAESSKIVQYEYAGELVFYFPASSQYRDSSGGVRRQCGEWLCETEGPYSSSTGCPDFAETRTMEKVLWVGPKFL